MTCDTILLSLIIGVVSGGYAGIVLSKYTAFCNAKMQLLFSIKSVYFEARDSKYTEVKFFSLETAALWLQELERLGHVEAGNTAYDVIKEAKKIFKQIQDVVTFPEARMPHTPNEMFSFLEKWQKQIADLSPNFCIIFSPFPKL